MKRLFGAYTPLRRERKRIVDAAQALVAAERGHGSGQVRRGRATRKDRAQLRAKFAHPDTFTLGKLP